MTRPGNGLADRAVAGCDAQNGDPPILAPLAGVLDRAAMEILQAGEYGIPLAALHVSTDVYDSVASARPREVQAGHRLILLGLRLVQDTALKGEDVRLV